MFRVGRRLSVRDTWDSCDTWDRGFWRGYVSRSKLLLTCDSWDRRFCAPLVLGFLDLWFVFLTHGFTHFCDGSRYGRKWSVDTLHGGFSFREQSERRNERLFLLEDRYKGVG